MSSWIRVDCEAAFAEWPSRLAPAQYCTWIKVLQIVKQYGRGGVIDVDRLSDHLAHCHESLDNVRSVASKSDGHWSLDAKFLTISNFERFNPDPWHAARQSEYRKRQARVTGSDGSDDDGTGRDGTGRDVKDRAPESSQNETRPPDQTALVNLANQFRSKTKSAVPVTWLYNDLRALLDTRADPGEVSRAISEAAEEGMNPRDFTLTAWPKWRKRRKREALEQRNRPAPEPQRTQEEIEASREALLSIGRKLGIAPKPPDTS